MPQIFPCEKKPDYQTYPNKRAQTFNAKMHQTNCAYITSHTTLLKDREVTFSRNRDLTVTVICILQQNHFRLFLTFYTELSRLGSAESSFCTIQRPLSSTMWAWLTLWAKPEKFFCGKLLATTARLFLYKILFSSNAGPHSGDGVRQKSNL